MNTNPLMARVCFVLAWAILLAVSGGLVHETPTLDYQSGIDLLDAVWLVVSLAGLLAVEATFRAEAKLCYWEVWANYLTIPERSFAVDPAFIRAFSNRSWDERHRLRQGPNAAP